ncbi:hypothetical protein CR513_37640, partial [Mucuna pruriens]
MDSIKADFEKSYDSMDWIFLDYMMVKFDLMKNGDHGYGRLCSTKWKFFGGNYDSKATGIWI